MGEPMYDGQANIEYEAARELYQECWNAALKRAADDWIAQHGFDKYGVAAFLIERELAGE